MFKKSRRKIVAAIMSVLALLWIGTLAVIYASSYFEMSERDRGMLLEHAERYVLHQPLGERPPGKPEPDPDPGRPRYSDLPSFQLSTFYTVAMTYEGEALEIKNPQREVHSDEELESHPRAVELLIGAFVPGLVGVDQRGGLGELLLGSLKALPAIYWERARRQGQKAILSIVR